MWFYSMLFTAAIAQTDRISSLNYNLATVDKIYVAAGLASVLEFPQNIIEVRVGDLSSVKAIISQASPKELTLYLSSSASKATNIIVRAEKKIYVFDVVPSTINHQDYVKIHSTFGSPGSMNNFTNHQSVKIEPSNKHTRSYKILSTNTEKVSP